MNSVRSYLQIATVGRKPEQESRWLCVMDRNRFGWLRHLPGQLNSLIYQALFDDAIRDRIRRANVDRNRHTAPRRRI